MRIGIFTLRLNTNIGGIIQAYALQTLLERHVRGGYKVSVINGYKERLINGKPVGLSHYPWWRLILSFCKRLLLKTFYDRSVWLSFKKEWELLERSAGLFIRKYINLDYYDDIGDVKEGYYDIIVVGSDQIWRPCYLTQCIGSVDCSSAFLSFAKDWDVKRYAYAASFGVDKWEFPTENTAEYAALAGKFIAVSVREDTGVELCRKYLGIDAKHVLDPTMVLSADDYMRLVSAADVPESRGTLFCYILDTNIGKSFLVERIAKKRGLKPFRIMNAVRGKRSEARKRGYPVIETWLRAFHDAEFVVTDSFHGCAFSIIFGKPFVAIGNIDRGLSRMQSLLRMFGIEDHLISDISEYDPRKSYALPASVGERLSRLRREALDFISQMG